MVVGFDGSRAFVRKEHGVPVSGRTGTENYSYYLLKALAEIDHKNTYLVYLRPGVEVRKEDWPDNFKFVSLNYAVLWTQRGLALQTFKDKLDVLFVPAHTLPLIRKPGLKTVVTVHDLGSEYLPAMHQLKQRLYLSFMQRHQLKTATKIIAVSNATKKDLIERIGINGKKVEVIYEGYDESLFKPVKTDTLVNSLKHYELIANNYFLFVGTVQPRKNLERVIKAFSKYAQSLISTRQSNSPSAQTSTGLRPDVSPSLVIVGSKGWLSDNIYSLPKQLGIEDRVKFLPPEGGRVGYVPDKDLPALYSGATAFLYPSLFEGFGLPILEAQACGCPVLTSNISSMPEVSGPPAGGGAILVDPYSVDDIVKGMERVKREGERVKLVKAGFENIKRFSWEKCAAQTLEVFEEIRSTKS